MRLIRLASDSCAVLVLVGILVAPAVADQARHDLLPTALKALRNGQTDRLVALFHYFEDAVD